MADSGSVLIFLYQAVDQSKVLACAETPDFDKV
jgi:hypothetical protein